MKTAHRAKRTNILLDEGLVKRALKLTGLKTKRALVQEALRVLIQIHEQEQIRTLRGNLTWQGDLAELRSDRIVS